MPDDLGPIMQGVTPQSATNAIALRFPATNSDVRHSMILLRRLLVSMGVFIDDIGKVELVLAEALNNIVEHACAGTDENMVGLDLKRTPSRLNCQICDPGKPMPNAQPPMGRVTDPTIGRDRLPEGGFGWMLIRSLSDNIHYQRIGETNRLTLSIPIRCAGVIGSRKSVN